VFELTDKTITFKTENHPDLEYDLIKTLVVKDKLILAVWTTDKLPYCNNKIAYYLYEDVLHFTKAEYIYFPVPGGAGMVLKPHLRNRFGVRDVLQTIKQG
jgi:hypothetical protein